MNRQELEKTAQAMVADGKGLLAMDESTPTCGKRLQAVGVDNTEANRVSYRELLLGANGIGDYISGAILYDETIRQKAGDGTPFPKLAERQGVIPGIKVDTGAKDLAGRPNEKVTEGLDGLRERLAEYYSLGARFCKWRAVITIGGGIPSRACIEANAHALARYAALCQEASMVPIVEPEVLIDGDHTLERSYEVTLETQRIVFDELYRQGVLFEGMILKPSMVIAGSARSSPVPEQVAEWTLRCLRSTVPAAVPGIAFLSGGQGDEQATQNLNAMNVLGRDLRLPWRVTSYYARAAEPGDGQMGRGKAANVEAARRLFLHRARCNGAASRGQYKPAMEQDKAA
ncbi:MAG: fructose-bisphosphate aldolase class I [Gammaproteobacteria bacterium]|nr:fructose-bisphosphate aldolase class I [Gammaproteobacteria bacterium]